MSRVYSLYMSGGLLRAMVLARSLLDDEDVLAKSSSQMNCFLTEMKFGLVLVAISVLRIWIAAACRKLCPDVLRTLWISERIFEDGGYWLDMSGRSCTGAGRATKRAD